jgi:glycosyltransferase involved in cell wall biosynthesis
VLPVGCDLRRFDPVLKLPPTSEPSPLILWNQRWEYDKSPETFFRALHALAEEGLNFQVALAGKNHRQTAPEFEAAREQLGDRVIHFGYANEPQYQALLHQADVVISTAIHEFFGVAVVEAMYCGCFPVPPQRMAYPELVPQPHHHDCLYEDFEGLMARLRWALAHPDRARALADRIRPTAAEFDWTHMGPRYDEVMMTLAATG